MPSDALAKLKEKAEKATPGPCPKCGGEPAFISDGMMDFMRCGSCGHEDGHCFDGCEEWCIKAWNMAARAATDKALASSDS